MLKRLFIIISVLFIVTVSVTAKEQNYCRDNLLLAAQKKWSNALI